MMFRNVAESYCGFFHRFRSNLINFLSAPGVCQSLTAAHFVQLFCSYSFGCAPPRLLMPMEYERSGKCSSIDLPACNAEPCNFVFMTDFLSYVSV